jgi:NitT/TauT family transport system substrate-binding protein
MTISSEVPLAFQGFERDDFCIVATIGSSDNEPRIIARRDRGIAEPQDLRDKRVATQRGSAVHYFLHLFLLKHGLSADDPAVRYLKAEDLPSALENGEIDAFSMREPFISQAESLLGENAIVFQEPGLYVKTMNLVALRSLTERRPEVIERVLLALRDAEAFVEQQPEAARRLVADRLGSSREEFTRIWQQLTLELSLGHSLLVSLEDEARWARAHGLVEAEPPPDYFGLLYLRGMKDVKPAAVTVIE